MIHRKYTHTRAKRNEEREGEGDREIKICQVKPQLRVKKAIFFSSIIMIIITITNIKYERKTKTDCKRRIRWQEWASECFCVCGFCFFSSSFQFVLFFIWFFLLLLFLFCCISYFVSLSLSISFGCVSVFPCLQNLSISQKELKSMPVWVCVCMSFFSLSLQRCIHV